MKSNNKKKINKNSQQNNNNGDKPRRITRSSNKKSVDIIRENQPLKFRQLNNQRDEQYQNDEQHQVQSDNEGDWEDGSLNPSTLSPKNQVNYDVKVNDIVNQINGVTVEFDALPESSSKKKRVRRATAEDKEVAELVHKAHLLCLIARGRFIDAACDDPLIQAALLSLLPSHLLDISEVTKLTINSLAPLVTWFHQNFHVKSSSSAEKPFNSALACALEMQGGSPEEVAALSVALFRALNLTTRFVSILDVASLKPEADSDEPPHLDRIKRKDVFSSSTLMVSKIKEEGTSSSSSVINGNKVHETSDQSTGGAQNISKEDNHQKRKGDLEFEMQLQMAMAATSVETSEMKPVESTSCSLSHPLNSLSPFKKLKRIAEESPSSSHVISTAIGSKKVGAPLYWAEVFCNGENLTGKWVHIDAVNSIVDGELKVEALAAACKSSLRYVVAFAGHGAKDVTRRYCAKWYQISPKRIDPGWWDAVLSSLKELESRATGGIPSKEVVGEVGQTSLTHAVTSGKSRLSEKSSVGLGKNKETCSSGSSVYSRSIAEDMELATRALTEPLPTNQQAYRNHPLYVIEKWLSKYQILHPKGPLLGFCSGHAVYPRTCVQTLHTKQRWLREGLQVRLNELPSKVVKSCYKNRKGQVTEVENSAEVASEADIALFGKWQTEMLCLPHAVDGKVPKNERGQVDVWSEKCLPPGTIHLRLPRLVPVAKRLGIDFAPAMVGFEFRNGRSVPVYEGIVVCQEFRETILEAYTEEEQRREEEEKKRDERQAMSRWYQLLSSMVTRQRLNDKYMNNPESETEYNDLKAESKSSRKDTTDVGESTPPIQESTHRTTVHDIDGTDEQYHEHVFLTDDESFVDDSMTQSKKCRCGLSIQVEEL
ncbi:DNA repair protein RAD4 [Silene latifolia]|uniref:DNA repair protein RAD4 n=1 Tax=Silene latifolia TaxID=37657 RepID=UPI003D78651E